MAVWRRKALAAFPDLRQELNRRDYSIYDLFSDLRTMLWEAHEEEDIETLRQIYGFAEWCMTRRAKTLWNPAGVSFYEHIFDRRLFWERVMPWLTPQVVYMVQGLWKIRRTPDELEGIRTLLVADGRFRSVGFGRLRSASVGFGRLRSASVGFGRLRSASVGFSRLQSASVGFSRLQSASVGFSRLQSASVGY